MKKAMVALALSLALAGCGGAADEPDDPTVAAPSPTEQTVGEVAGVDTSLTDAEQADLLKRLGAIDPALASEDYVTEARNVCLDIQQGKDAAAITRNVKLRFSGGDVGDVTDAEAESIVTAVRQAFCS